MTCLPSGARFPRPGGAPGPTPLSQGPALAPAASVSCSPRRWSRKSRAKRERKRIWLASFHYLTGQRESPGQISLSGTERQGERSGLGGRGGSIALSPAPRDLTPPPLAHPKALPSRLHPITELFLATQSILAVCCRLPPATCYHCPPTFGAAEPPKTQQLAQRHRQGLPEPTWPRPCPDPQLCQSAAGA